MQKIIAPINPNSTQADIANLQDALALFLQKSVFQLSDADARIFRARLHEERAVGKYSDITNKLVGMFQSMRNIPPADQVDDATAGAINVLLREFGALDGDNSGWTEVVGAIRDQTRALNAIHTGTDHLGAIDQKIGDLGQSLRRAPTLALNGRGDLVRELHNQLSNLGVTLPTSETTDGFFGAGTLDAVLQLQAKYDLAQTGVLDDATRNAINIAIGNVSHSSRVEGRIFLDNGLPAAKVKLRIVNKGFGDDAPTIGDVETDERGFYALPYNLDGALASANIEVRALDAAGDEIRLSAPRVNADRNEVLNLVAPSIVQSQTSEFNLMAGDLRRFVGADLGKLAGAKEDDKHNDLSMMYEATGWDARLTATAASAAIVSAATQLPLNVMYGALRAGLPDDPDALAEVSPEAFDVALTRANDAGVITLDVEQMGAAKKAFGEFAVQTRRKLVAPGALSSMGDLLDRARIDDDQKATFEQLALLHDGDDTSLWREAKAQGVSDSAISSLQLQGKLAFLTLNNAPLTDVLQSEIQSQDQLAQLVDKDLYKPEQWGARLNAMATENDVLNEDKLAALIPRAYSHKEATARRDAYAADMAAKIRAAFPTQVVQRRIEIDELKLGAEHADLKAPVQMLLKNASDTGFQLGRMSIEQLKRQQGGALFEGIAADKRALAEEGAKLLTRVYQMTPNDDAMSALLDLGFTSARQVTTIPKADFIERYWERFGSRKVAEATWEKSSQISSVTFSVFAMAKKIDSTPPVLTLSGTPEQQQKDKDDLNALLKDYPTMQSLFGSLDFCECEHCRSVLSPAAYLVDLLRFIDPLKKDWEITLADWKNKHNGKDYDGLDYKYLKPYDALMLRRPDLPHLPLTCENTNTALPYIDLVNEILEYYVANKSLDANAAHDTGEATSAELMGEPQNVVPKAYEILKAARFPLTLPFDLWLESVRRFCDYFEAPLWRVLDAFRPSEQLFEPASFGRADIFREALGLSPDEYAIYTNATFVEWPKLYGYDSGNEAAALAKLKSAKTLADRLGVSYKELAALVQTAFVNPKLNALVTLNKLGVELNDVFRYKEFSGYAKLDAEDKAAFEKRLADATEKYKTSAPPFDAAQWLIDAWDAHAFEGVLVLHDPTAGCSFDETLVAHSDSTDVPALTFVKLNLFVRMWKRLGWTMDETDRALTAFTPAGVLLADSTLGDALKTALIYMAHLKELSSLVNVGKNARGKLLTLWTQLPTMGKASLYTQLFLIRNILKDDAIFDHPLGQYLTAPNTFLKDHLPAVQAALGLTADEAAQILAAGNTGDEADIGKAHLSLANVSLLHRYGLLAKALKFTVNDVVALKALSGLDPFHALAPDALDHIAKDYPLHHTLAFVKAAQRVKGSGLSVTDLDYLFRHRIDPTSKYALGDAAQWAWLRPLAEDVRVVTRDFAVPANADALSDDALREKMALVFGPDVVETFMGFWSDKATYSTMRTPISPAQRLSVARYSLPDTNVSYDETRQRQQVTHTGVLTTMAKTGLLAGLPPPASAAETDARQLFSDLLDEIVVKSGAQFKQFFSDHFDGLLKFDDFFGGGVVATPAKKRLDLLKIILPFLRDKLMRQKIGQALTSQTGGDAALVDTLATRKAFLALADDATAPLMTWFERLGRSGLSASLFQSIDQSGPPAKTDVVSDIAVIPGNGVNSAQWQGHITVPKDGAYRFYAALGKKDATVEVRIDCVADAIVSDTATSDSAEISGFAELQAGVTYALTVTAGNLQDGAFHLLAKGETTPKSELGQFVLTPQTAVDAALRAQTMLSKAVHLAQSLNLTEREVRHILAHPTDFGRTPIDWKLLPVQASDANAVALFNSLDQMLDYVALRRDAADGGEGLSAILEQARQTTPPNLSELCARVAALTRRKASTVQDVAAEVGMTQPIHFADVARLMRLWRALQIVEKFGVQMASLKTWLTPQPDVAVARSVRDAIKSRYDQEAWRRIAKPIFDPLRQRQRDALVAHIQHINPQLDSTEKLFEYFLIDPGTEPVVQTSRLRLAISALQTFIQRCFLNLEKQVHTSVLNARHWAWMKRYRVWEANRKIFLFPENWLEPEWRDDKTHLFQELESSLLQGDVSNQLAEDALYVYLKKLDVLARLDIVTMYAEERPPGPPIIHVIGRTYAQPRQYFYRRYANQMWTPWEPVSAEIEGDHIVAAVWRERLYLFWLTFMEKLESAGKPKTTQKGELGSMQIGALVSAAADTAGSAVKRTLDIQLNWSEYFQGDWTTRETTGFGNIITPPNAFAPSEVYVSVSKEIDPETGGEGAVWINMHGVLGAKPKYQVSDKLKFNPLGGVRGFNLADGVGAIAAIDVNKFAIDAYFTPGFRVISKNSQPQLLATSDTITSPFSPKSANFNRYVTGGSLAVTFVPKVETTDGKTVTSPPAPQIILGKGNNYSLLTLSNKLTLPNAEFAPLISPVFYADDVNTFFIEPSLTETTVDKWEGYVITRPSQKPKWRDYVVEGPKLNTVIPPKYYQEALKLPPGKPQPDPIDLRAFYSIKPNEDALTQPHVAVKFGDTLIGNAGRVQDVAREGITQIVGRVGQAGGQI